MVDFLVTLLLLLVLFAVIAYIINTYIVIDQHLRNLIMLVLGVLLLIWIILAIAGTAPYIPLRRGP